MNENNLNLSNSLEGCSQHYVKQLHICLFKKKNKLGLCCQLEIGIVFCCCFVFHLFPEANKDGEEGTGEGIVWHFLGGSLFLCC